MERSEKKKPEMLDRGVRSMRAKSDYVEKSLIGEKGFCMPLTAMTPADLMKSSKLTQAQLEKLSRAYDDARLVSGRFKEEYAI